MIAKPPPSPPGVARKLDLVELRMGNLRRELEAETDPSVRAAILYHMGSLYEHELGRPADATDHYARARDASPEFEPAAIAAMRMAERLQPRSELEALCTAHVASAREPAAIATALLDLGLRSGDWASLLREAVARAPEPAVPALILEWLADAGQDRDALRDALWAQAEHAADPELQAALWLDLALAEIDDGDIDVALQALELACASEQLVWQARSLQRRTAREHERWNALVSATTSMARLLEGEAPSDPLSSSIPGDERLPMAALLWQEAASICAVELADADAAAGHLESALRLFPEDRVLRLQALFVAERRGDDEAMARASAWFVDSAPDDPAFVAYKIRRASSSGQETGLELLREASALHPQSEYARAALEVALLRSGADGERTERLCQRADATEGEARAQLLWHAARLVARGAAGPRDAQSLYVEAAGSAGPSKTRILRDALDAAIRDGDASAILARSDDLLGADITAAERTLLNLCKYDVTQHALRDEEAAELLLRDALADPSGNGWVPHVARARAALSDSPALLAAAHEALASLTEGDAEVEHLCAAGRAYARCGDWDSAERVLRKALRRAPDDGYVVSSLGSVLRDAGKPEEIVALAQSRTNGPSKTAVGELSLLLTGATAERDGNLVAARHAYEQALRQAPDSPSAALALSDIARRQGDETERLRAYDRLSCSTLGGGVAELFALLRADALSLAGGGAGDASASYERALDHPITALPAAAALLTTPFRFTTDDQRGAAEETLADAGASQTGAGNGFGAAYAALRGALGEPRASTGGAWLEMAARAPNEDLEASALLHGLRNMRIARGEQAIDELFMLAQRSEELASSQPEAAITFDELLAPGDDPELRASTLRTKLEHSSALGHGALDAALARALVEADRGDEAVAILSNAIDERPDDLGLWETLRVAARQAGQWALVAQSCERMARFVDGALRADLLEEAGAVRLDCLQQYQQAEDSFRSALEADPTREIAFRRLHDLLTEREDAEALEELVSARLALGGPKDRPELLYERARLLRGFSDRPGALEVLDELFTAEPEHVGALALAAEVHVSLEQWDEAVECLRRLSTSDIPDAQRRVAHLGAADFLQTRLGKKDEALAELRAVEALGLADADTWLRIGGLEEGFSSRAAAIDAYAQALATEPTHEAAVARLADLMEGEERDAVLSRYEDAMWARIDAGELDESLLEGLRKSAHRRGDLERAMAIAAVEAAVEPGSPPSQGGTDLSHVSMGSIWDPDSRTLVEEVVRRAGPALFKDRVRTKKLTPSDAVYGELERLTERFGARLGSVGVSDQVSGVAAYAGRDGEVHWVVPRSGRDGLDGVDLFVAGRLAWAVPRGAGSLLDDSREKAAGTLAAVLRAARCRVGAGEPVLPAVGVKLRRATRKAVQEAVGDVEIQSSELLAAARRLHRSADRAGLLASGDIAAALSTLFGGRATMTALQTSARGLDLLRFWGATDSPLWGNDA